MRLARHASRHGLQQYSVAQAALRCSHEQRAAARVRTATASLDCPHFHAGCGGCAIEHDLQSPPVLRQARAFFAARDVLFECTLLQRHGWRTRAKLAVRATRNGPAIGLFRRGSHDVYPLRDCPLHHPRINEALAVLWRAVDAHGISAYREVPLRKRSRRGVDAPESSGLLRYVQLTTCAAGGVAQTDARAAVQLVCVVNCSEHDADATRQLERMLHAVYAKHGCGQASSSKQQGKQSASSKNASSEQSGGAALFHSIWLNFSTRPENRIMGGAWRRVAGPQWMWHQLPHVRIALHPASFVQVRVHAAQGQSLRILHELAHRRV